MLCKKTLLLFSIIFLLCGCNINGQNIENSASKIKQTYSNLSDFDSQIKFLCDCGQSILEYDCDFEYNKEYGQTLTITSPASLSGVEIKSTGNSADNINISYNETVLDFDVSAQFGTSPAEFMPALLPTLMNNEPNEVWEETQGNQKLLVARYETISDDKPMTSQVWFYKTTLLPMYAEIYTDGERVLQAFFTS